MPKVTVLISAYNASETIDMAVNSIVGQSIKDIEILIMDDGSQDDTLAKLNSFQDDRITIYSQENAGKAAALNKLINSAKGEYLVVQDADDWSHPKRLEVMSQIMDSERDLAMLFSGYSLIINDKICAPRRTNLNRDSFKATIDDFRLPSLDPTMMVRTAIGKSFKFNTILRMGQGIDFVLRVGEVHPAKVIPDILYCYRFHYASITKSKHDIKVASLYKIDCDARKRRNLRPLSEKEFYALFKGYLEDKNNNLDGHFSDSAYLSVQNGKRKEALKTAFLSARYARRGGLRYFKPLIYTLSPKFFCNFFRNTSRV